MTETICKRCGKCCHWIAEGKVIKCKYLIKLSNDRTLCRIYKNRKGYIMSKGMICGDRLNSRWNYEGCPYNELSPDKPMFPNI